MHWFMKQCTFPVLALNLIPSTIYLQNVLPNWVDLGMRKCDNNTSTELLGAIIRRYLTFLALEEGLGSQNPPNACFLFLNGDGSESWESSWVGISIAKRWVRAGRAHTAILLRNYNKILWGNLLTQINCLQIWGLRSSGYVPSTLVSVVLSVIGLASMSSYRVPWGSLIRTLTHPVAEPPDLIIYPRAPSPEASEVPNVSQAFSGTRVFFQKVLESYSDSSTSVIIHIRDKSNRKSFRWSWQEPFDWLLLAYCYFFI